MGKIPQYDAQKLESPVVGTPGVFTAPAQTMTELSTGAGQIEDIAQKEANAAQVTDAYKLYRAQQAQDAVNKQVDTANMDTQVAKTATYFNTSAGQVHTNLFQKYQMDPTGAMEDYTNQLKDLKDKALIPLQPGSLEYAKTDKQLTEAMGTNINSFQTQLRGQTYNIAIATAKQNADSLGVTLNDWHIPPEQAMQILNQWGKDNSQLFTNVHGPDAPQKIREAQSDAVKSYLEQTALNDQGLGPDGKPAMDENGHAIPGTGLTEQRIKAFSNILLGKDSGDFISRIRQTAAEQRQAAAQEYKLHQQVHDSDVIMQLHSSSPTGKLSDADPKQLYNARKDPNISPGLRNVLSATAPQAAATAVLKQDDNKILQQAGTQAAYVDKLNGRVQDAYDAAMAKGLRGDARSRAYGHLSQTIQQWTEAHAGLIQMLKQVQSPEGKAAAANIQTLNGDGFKHALGVIRNEDSAKAQEKVFRSYKSALGAPGSAYTNQKAQAAYAYYYNVGANDKYRGFLKSGNLLQVYSNQKQMATLRHTLSTWAHQQVNRMGFADGQ